MLRLDDVWAWDFWLADDGEQHHLFFYSGRLVQERDGGWALLAFRNRGPDGFVGEITDPMPVAWDETGRLVVRA